MRKTALPRLAGIPIIVDHQNRGIRILCGIDEKDPSSFVNANGG